MQLISLFAIIVCSLLPCSTSASSNTGWQTIAASGTPTARHEAAFVPFQGQLYLIGGRRINPVDRFDPESKKWTECAVTPMELHHFQAVVVDEAIYLVGAMTGRWPNETPLEKVVIYYPKEDRFEFGHTIPEARRRGGAGAAVYSGSIYIVGGITNGHQDGYQPWLDRYDPKTGEWEALADAPHARDHFQAVILHDRLYAAAGRTTSQRTKQGFDLTVPEVDVYDLKKDVWLPNGSVPNLPTPRAGNMAANVKGHLVIGGGECGRQKQAHSEVEAFNPKTGRWTSWAPLQRGRHGSGFAVAGNRLYTASGSGNRGGGPELNSIEEFDIRSPPIQASGTEDHQGLWHRKTLSFTGPATSETATPNPFTDYRLMVTFRNGRKSVRVRGFYAADGNASESSAASGAVWTAHFCPDEPGEWTWKAELRMGPDIAIKTQPEIGKVVQLSNTEGRFHVSPAEEANPSRSFYDNGRLTVRNGYFQFADGRYWLKGGTNSPENLLAYTDFDGTYRVQAKARDGEAAPPTAIHRFQAHANDWQPGDPTWKDGRGKNLVGAINYLASTGMNTAYFLTMNIGGDGNDVWPYVNEEQWDRFDCSKLDQWDIVFQHMQEKGILLHIVTQETENERMLDDGDCGRLRRLYYAELIARFGAHPGLIWNLGEENGPAHFSPNGQTSEQQRQMATVLKELDPYDHPVVIHTHSTKESKEDLLPPLLNHTALDGLSLQVNQPQRVNEEIITWNRKAKASGHPWVICMDEIGKWDTGLVPDSVDASHDDSRRLVLWGSLMAGAAGIEWYFGAHHPHNDLNSEDWRQRASMWAQTNHALTFFRQIPYWDMNPANELLDQNGCYCLAQKGRTYAVYLPQNVSTAQLDLKGVAGTASIQWFNPRDGGKLKPEKVNQLQPSDEADRRKLQLDPPDRSGDWVALISIAD